MPVNIKIGEIYCNNAVSFGCTNILGYNVSCRKVDSFSNVDIYECEDYCEIYPYIVDEKSRKCIAYCFRTRPCYHRKKRRIVKIKDLNGNKSELHAIALRNYALFVLKSI